MYRSARVVNNFVKHVSSKGPIKMSAPGPKPQLNTLKKKKHVDVVNVELRCPCLDPLFNNNSNNNIKNTSKIPELPLTSFLQTRTTHCSRAETEDQFGTGVDFRIFNVNSVHYPARRVPTRSI
jgi:hypothetical protein|uniref:Uncharacterized protein n=1 Tax=Sipha flava TaxID=143950 RepID=A0A2S2R8Z4_9HEMI